MMNGPRPQPTRQADRTSLEALNRTIEGLEARIEGLLHQEGRVKPQPALRDEPEPAAARRPIRNGDLLAEIRERQRALQAAREAAPEAARRTELPAAPSVPAPPAAAAAIPAAAATAPRDTLGEIADALSNLRADLKRDIGEGVAREMSALRNEIRAIRDDVGARPSGEDVRVEMARLAEGLDLLAHRSAAPEADSLRGEFQELRSLMDGLAREDGLRRIETRWDGVEERLHALDTAGLQDELVSLAYRLDDMKRQLAAMGDSAAVRALEDKLIGIASAMEQFADAVEPHDRTMTRQFAAVDERLDEISRAIAAGSRAGGDPAGLYRLETRINALAEQIELMSSQAPRAELPLDALGERLEALIRRVDDLASDKASQRLDEKLDRLTQRFEHDNRAASGDALTAALGELARKIDGLEATRASQPAETDGFRRLENRLSDIAARLEESTAAPPADARALENLEAQIMHLSALLSEPRPEMALPQDFDRRMGAIEDYLATSDEYVVEAARQAAETAVAAYARAGHLPQAGAGNVDALEALAKDLRQLEDMARNSEERTHKTFEALHDTLIQIASRLNDMETQAPAPVSREPALALAERPTAHPAEDLPVAETSALAIEAATGPTRSSGAASPSLLAGIGRRLISKRKAKADAKADRALIDPTPSIDPVDVMPPESDELLEPGSGAPDVRKILERVRASQAARAAEGGEPEALRADFIAAARRAAQAAAQEADQTQKPGDKARRKAGGFFERFRRPILLAVGAVLLAIMAFPLARTLVGSQAEAPREVAALSDVANNPPAAPALPATEEAAPVETSEPAANAAPVASSQNRLTEAAPISGQAPAPITAAPLPPVDTASSFAPADKPAAAVPAPAEAAAGLPVPDSIQPKPLADAARAGDPLALIEIGARYSDGRGVAADAAESARWYQLAADKGFAPAQYRLGSLYEKGNGVARDLEQARKLYAAAADQGNANAMHNLAVLYASGALGQQDYATAAHWFARAADLGVTDSQFNLAILNARGNGVPVDLTESYKWFDIAAKGGDQDAGAKRDEVAKAMKPADLAKAKAKVEAWKPQMRDAKANDAALPDAWTAEGGKSTSGIDMKRAVRNIQAILNRNGFDAGTPDGEMGAKTMAALKSFQKSIGQEPTGRIDNDTVRALLDRNKPVERKA